MLHPYLVRFESSIVRSRWDCSFRKYCNGSFSPRPALTTKRLEFDVALPIVQQRMLSSSISKRKQSPIQDEEFQHEQHGIPKWPVVASILMAPLMFVACQVSDYIFGNRQIGMNERLRQDFQQRYSPQSLEAMPTLFCCIIRKTHGFTHCLSGIRIGDVVEVLEEGVGPLQAYNLCRVPTDHRDSVSKEIYGWFPYRWLEKLDHYESVVQKQQVENNH
jgi:hypothetical protein